MAETLFGLLCVESARTRAYLSALEQAGLQPSHVVFLELDGAPGGGLASAVEVPYFDNLTPARDRIQRMALPHVIVRVADINSPAVVDAIRPTRPEVFIYSGPGGAILGPGLLSLRRFLHVHPGIVPDYRGSTTLYYSLMLDGTCGASAIFLAPRIDEGPVLATREYPPPDDRRLLDYGYDPFIRADLLVRVLRRSIEQGGFQAAPQPASDRGPFYVMHPVLRHIAILGSATASLQD